MSELVFRCQGETWKTYLAKVLFKKMLSKGRNRGSKKLFVGDYLGKCKQEQATVEKLLTCTCSLKHE